MSGLRCLAVAIAVIVFATPLLAQPATTVRDTTALARLPVTITPPVSSIVLGARPVAHVWTSQQAAAAPVSRPLATWSRGDGSHTTSAAMMIVGGAGLLVGTVVSGRTGKMILLGGGLVGLAGLWSYAK
ncbi:MAG TPA: hypothetical protein VIP11_24335 [Gemmatimonadaceae bacterium]